MQGLSGKGNAKAGTSSIAAFSRAKASSASDDQTNLVPLRVNRVKGSAMVANPQ